MARTLCEGECFRGGMARTLCEGECWGVGGMTEDIVHSLLVPLVPPPPPPPQDVDQVTGEDLNPSVNRMLTVAGGEESSVARNPDR